jgi:hypothetical protein
MERESIQAQKYVGQLAESSPVWAGSATTQIGEASTVGVERTRLHHLDALRAFAMLLGIALHAALAYAIPYWIVVDARQSKLLGLLFLGIHGFRMQLFFLLSGYFTAMLWKRFGLRALVFHRARRVAIPLALGCVTVLPVMWGVSRWAGSVNARAAMPREGVVTAIDSARDVWTAARFGNINALKAHLLRGASPNGVEPISGQSPLGWAVIGGHEAAVDVLLALGANASGRFRDGNTPLHNAAFLGRATIATQLLAAGAEVAAMNERSQRPLDALRHDRATTEFIASLLQISIDFPQVLEGREQVRVMLQLYEAESGFTRREGTAARSDANSRHVGGRIVEVLRRPFFDHLWFLWFLCWMIGAFALFAKACECMPYGASWQNRFASSRALGALVATPIALVWLVPLTVASYAWMHPPESRWFGAETSTSVFPMPSALVHYALFFAFGTLLFLQPHGSSRFGRWWWIALPLAVVVFPIALGFSMQAAWTRDVIASDGVRRLISLLGSSLYAWLACIALLGLFERCIHRERPSLRYLSDAAYWLYLAHLPVVLAGQILMRDVDIPAMMKFSVVLVGSTALVLVAYEFFVRYSWVGRLLNGARSPRHSGRRVLSLTKRRGPE